VLGGIGFEAHFDRWQPATRTPYYVALAVPVTLAAIASALGRIAGPRELRIAPLGCLAVPLLVIGVALGSFDAFVMANALLDTSPHVPRTLRMTSIAIELDEDNENPSFVADVIDEAAPTETMILRVQEPPFPDTSMGLVNVAVCPGALGMRWFCTMP
jgi:hypothetical protein